MKTLPRAAAKKQAHAASLDAALAWNPTAQRSGNEGWETWM